MSFFVFIFGLLIGSFLNCFIYRLELKEFQNKSYSPFKGRSFCPNCKHVLAWYDLIPVVSFFILRAKCRYCSKKISIQYPLVELLTGLIFLYFFLSYSWPLAIYYTLVSCFLIIVFVFDLKHFIIPDVIVFPAIIMAFFYGILNSSLLGIYSGLGAGLFFLLIFLLSKGKWLGFGDVKLALFMGLFLGYPQILIGLFLSFFIGAIIGIILILFKKKGLKSEVPFGPFLVIGTYLGLLWGREIFDWYLKLLAT